MWLSNGRSEKRPVTSSCIASHMRATRVHIIHMHHVIIAAELKPWNVLCDFSSLCHKSFAVVVWTRQLEAALKWMRYSEIGWNRTLLLSAYLPIFPAFSVLIDWHTMHLVSIDELVSLENLATSALFPYKPYWKSQDPFIGQEHVMIKLHVVCHSIATVHTSLSKHIHVSVNI